MIDSSVLGALAAEFMQTVEESFEDDATLGVVAIVVEVNVEGDPGHTEVLYRCSDNRRWVQRGLFSAADRAVDYSTMVGEDEDYDPPPGGRPV